MTRWGVDALVPIGKGHVSHCEVEAPTRGKALTLGARKLNVHRDMILSVRNLNPLDGGGSKRG